MSSVILDQTRVTLGLSTTAPTSQTTYNTTVTVSGIPITYKIQDGTSGADLIEAAEQAAYIFGFDGNDTIDNEEVTGIMLGGNGNDRFILHDNLALAGGIDGTVADFEVGTDVIDLSETGVTSFSQLTISTNAGGTSSTITSSVGTLKFLLGGLSGLGSLSASSFAFDDSSVSGHHGGDDDDSIDGSDDGESLSGGHGSDDIDCGNGNDTVYGGQGRADSGDAGDTIRGGHGSDEIYGNAGADTLYGGQGRADSGDSADTLYGGGGSDQVFGNAGDDKIFGGGNNADPSDTADTIYGGSGADSCLGNGGDDVIYGGGSASDPTDGADTIYGGLGDDSIFGNGGADVIYGLAGNDYMHGGLGDDIYVFGASSGEDIIAHFEGEGASGGDVIRVGSNINSNGITTTAQLLAAVSYSDGKAFIDLGSGNVIQVNDITAGAFVEGDFQIA